MRRALLAALACACIAPALALPSGAQNIYESGIPEELKPVFRQAWQAMRARDWDGAHALLQAARERIDSNPGRLASARAFVFPYLGWCLVQLGRPTDAIAVLEPLLGKPGHLITTVAPATALAGMASTMESTEAHEGATTVRGKALYRTPEQVLFDDGPEAFQLTVALACAYSGAGRPDDLESLFRRTSNGDDAERPDFLAVLRAGRFAGLLVAQKRPVAAQQALARALGDIDSDIRASLAKSDFLGLMSSRAALHRLLAEAGMGNALSQSAPIAQHETALASLIECLGLASRFRQKLNTILDADPRPEARAVRDNLIVSEDSADVESGDRELQVRAGLGQVARFATLGSSDAVLKGKGLEQVFQPGATLIDGLRARSRGPAILGFLPYRPYRADGRGLDAAQYVRFVLCDGVLELRPLGSAADLEAMVTQWRDAVGTNTTAGARKALGRRVKEALLGNLPNSVHVRTDWAVFAQGPVSLLSFDTLPGRDHAFLVQEHCLRHINDIVSWLQPAVAAQSRSARVIGSPAYPEDLGGIDPNAIGDDTRSETDSAAKALRGMGLTVDVRSGVAASIHALGFFAPPAYLHVAAHGLFSPMATEGAEAGPDPDVLVHRTLPGRHSALLLGDGRTLQIVTGDYLRTLNLRGTRLVTLSACDSGVGVDQEGEGMASLRWAVELAGACGSITALWPVPSRDTTQLMREFYAALEQGHTVGEALRSAKLAAIRSGLDLQAWGAFVFAGREVS